MRTRAIGLAPYTPPPAQREVIDDVSAILAEYAGFGQMTIRQIFYRLVATCGYPKDERAYKALVDLLGRARRGGLIPFESIRDDGAVDDSPWCYKDAEHLRAVLCGEAARAHLDRQRGQPVRLWLMCEGAGMVPLLAAAVGPLGVPVMSGGGFDSLSSKYALAVELSKWDVCEVLHLGDLDPSGVAIFESLERDVTQLVADLGSDTEVTFTRIGLTRSSAVCRRRSPRRVTAVIAGLPKAARA